MRRKILAALAVPFLAAVTLVGCSPSEHANGGEANTEVTMADLAGSWHLTSTAEGAAPVELNVPVGLSVEEDGAYHLDATCNAMNGSFTVEDGTVTSSPLMSTRMACPEDVSVMEAILAGTFSDLTSVHFGDDGVLVFDGAGNALVFARD